MTGKKVEDGTRKSVSSIPVRPRDQVERHEPGVAVAPLGHTVFPIPVRHSAGAYVTGEKVEGGTLGRVHPQFLFTPLLWDTMV